MNEHKTASFFRAASGGGMVWCGAGGGLCVRPKLQIGMSEQQNQQHPDARGMYYLFIKANLPTLYPSSLG